MSTTVDQPHKEQLTHAVKMTQRSQKSVAFGIGVNTILALAKGVAGVVGNSHALIADAIESLCDIVSSIAVLYGLRIAARPPDHNHPYGHGKFEPLAAAVVAVTLFAAALLISVQSVQQILTPHPIPAPFTLIVLALVIVIKEGLFRFVITVGSEVDSVAVKNEAWHHRSDALTSLAAFVGITIAIVGGPGYEIADEIAAIFASIIIAINAYLLFKPALFELTDAAPRPILAERIRSIAISVPGVLGTHKCHVRKLGFDHFVDLDILCDPDATIRTGHEIAHAVGEAIHQELPLISKVLIHVEPVDDYGKRSRNQ